MKADPVAADEPRPGAALEAKLRTGEPLDELRRLGVPKTLMSDFEFTAAVFRDSQFDPAAERPELMGGYDRRGLLNVIAWLARSLSDSEPPPDIERLGQLISDALEYSNDGLVIAKAIAPLMWDQPQPALPSETPDPLRAAAILAAKGGTRWANEGDDPALDAAPAAGKEPLRAELERWAAGGVEASSASHKDDMNVAYGYRVAIADVQSILRETPPSPEAELGKPRDAVAEGHQEAHELDWDTRAQEQKDYTPGPSELVDYGD